MKDPLLFNEKEQSAPVSMRLTSEDLMLVKSWALDNFMKYGSGTRLAGETKELNDTSLSTVAWVEAVASLLYRKNKCGMLNVERDSGSSEPETEW